MPDCCRAATYRTRPKGAPMLLHSMLPTGALWRIIIGDYSWSLFWVVIIGRYMGILSSMIIIRHYYSLLSFVHRCGTTTTVCPPSVSSLRTESDSAAIQQLDKVMQASCIYGWAGGSSPSRSSHTRHYRDSAVNRATCQYSLPVLPTCSGGDSCFIFRTCALLFSASCPPLRQGGLHHESALRVNGD